MKLRWKDYGNLKAIIFHKSYRLTTIISLLSLNHYHFSTLLKCYVLRILCSLFQGNIVTILTGLDLGLLGNLFEGVNEDAAC